MIALDELENLVDFLYVPWLIILTVTVFYGVGLALGMFMFSLLGDVIAVAALSLTVFRLTVIILIDRSGKERFATSTQHETKEP